jgi:ribose transport system ATP-binding protein
MCIEIEKRFNGGNLLMSDHILEIYGVSKSFPGVKALDNINLKIKKGEVHALVGENGAGKTTLIRLISGIYKVDSGAIFYDGEELINVGPHDCIEKGISSVHQDFRMVETLTVAENIFLGKPLMKKSFIGRNVDWVKMRKEAVKAVNAMGVDVDPNAIIGDLSVAKKQVVEICKALQRNVTLLILDEPTAALTENEIEILFGLIRKMKEKGITIIYISHRIEEIFKIADTVTVLRDGKTIITDDVANLDRAGLIKHMTGRKIVDIYPEKNKSFGDTVLEVKNLCSEVRNLSNISFSLREGEILGITGLVGAGRTELVRAIFGADRYDSGAIYVKGKKIESVNILKMIKLSVGLVPEERKVEGFIPDFSVSKNVTLAGIEKIIRYSFLNNTVEKKATSDLIKLLRIVTPSAGTQITSLSGGNQQKCIVGKWLYVDSDILIFDEPTRGIDVGAKQEMYKIITNLAKQGKAIIIVSSELPEVLGICNRIIVMCKGKVNGELNADEADQEEILNLAIA